MFALKEEEITRTRKIKIFNIRGITFYVNYKKASLYLPSNKLAYKVAKINASNLRKLKCYSEGKRIKIIK